MQYLQASDVVAVHTREWRSEIVHQIDLTDSKQFFSMSIEKDTIQPDCILSKTLEVWLKIEVRSNENSLHLEGKHCRQTTPLVNVHIFYGSFSLFS